MPKNSISSSVNGNPLLPASTSVAGIPRKVQFMAGMVIIFAALTLNNYLLVLSMPKNGRMHPDQFLPGSVMFSLVFMLGMLLVAGFLRCLSPCFLFFGRCVRGTVIVSRRLAQEEVDF